MEKYSKIAGLITIGKFTVEFEILAKVSTLVVTLAINTYLLKLKSLFKNQTNDSILQPPTFWSKCQQSLKLFVVSNLSQVTWLIVELGAKPKL